MHGILLYLDEIQYLNKKQQQSLLEYIESGDITLIASTTENPYFAVYNALISRSTVFEFKAVPPEELQKAVERAFSKVQKNFPVPITIAEGVCAHIAGGCGGDVRKAMNTVELCVLSAEKTESGLSVSLELAQELTQRSNMRYDRENDQHYDLLSALQKSIRGSDENAALHYAARLLAAGDLLSICRRLLVIASEDIGLAYPQAIVITKACVDSALQLGLPEAQIPLAEAVVLLATAPKSNSAYLAMHRAMEDVENMGHWIFHGTCRTVILMEQGQRSRDSIIYTRTITRTIMFRSSICRMKSEMQSIMNLEQISRSRQLLSIERKYWNRTKQKVNIKINRKKDFKMDITERPLHFIELFEHQLRDKYVSLQPCAMIWRRSVCFRSNHADGAISL